MYKKSIILPIKIQQGKFVFGKIILIICNGDYLYQEVKQTRHRLLLLKSAS